MKKNEKYPSVKQLKPFWDEYEKAATAHRKKMFKIEQRMRDELKNDQLMFFHCDGEIVGIGTEDRKMELVHDIDFVVEEW